MANSFRMPVSGRISDRAEQIAALALYFWLAARLWPGEFSAANGFPLLILLSEGMVVLLLLIRKPTARISTDVRDWAVAAGGTFLALMVAKGGEPLSLAGGVILMLIGMATHVGAKLCLWRSFGLVAAHRGLKVGGLYAVVRHPMYAGYVIAHVGYLLVAPSWWNLAIYLAVWSLLVARIFAEERILGQDPDYLAFKTRVHYRLVPGVF